MSRRTKLLITALFLVLLAIPVVYVVLLWRPENALRVRVLTAAESPQAPALNPGIGMIPLMVENTSSVPIRLYGMWEGDRIPTGGWSSYSRLTPAPTRPSREFLLFLSMTHPVVVPPHSSIRYHAVRTPDSLQHPSEKVFCISTTGVKHTVMSALDWCKIHAPGSLRFLLPDLQLDYHILPVHTPGQPPADTAPSR